MDKKNHRHLIVSLNLYLTFFNQIELLNCLVNVNFMKNDDFVNLFSKTNYF